MPTTQSLDNNCSIRKEVGSVLRTPQQTGPKLHCKITGLSLLAGNVMANTFKYNKWNMELGYMANRQNWMVTLLLNPMNEYSNSQQTSVKWLGLTGKGCGACIFNWLCVLRWSQWENSDYQYQHCHPLESDLKNPLWWLGQFALCRDIALFADLER